MKRREQIKELKGLDHDQLKTKIAGLNRELLNLRFRNSSGRLQQTASLKTVRRQRARAMTMLRQKAQQEA